MSLADELNTENERFRTLTTDGWFTQWHETLSPEDQETVDAWVSDPTKSASALYRVVKSHGYQLTCDTFRDWVARQRG